MSTIFAVSSGRPPAAIAILRISGPGARDALTRLAGSLPPPRRASVRRLHHPTSGVLIDQALVLLLPGPNTATGEDIVELHLHGGRAVVRATEDALASLPGLRAAEPGEFTRRALMNGRMDLSQAEGLGDLLMAETEAQRRLALAHAEGAVRRLAEQWAASLNALSATAEALLDHADEDDVADQEARVADRLRGEARALSDAVRRMLADPPLERLRDGLRVVLAGPPNSGKSTLLNAMAGREAAIVSPIAGTTRDRIELPVQRDGIAWLLIDTAGLAEETLDPVERIGIARSRGAIAAADVVLWLGDGPAPEAAAAVIPIHARADIAGREEPPPGRVRIAAAQGDLGALWEALEARARDLLPADDALALNARQRTAIEALAEDLDAATRNDDPILVAEHLRRARWQIDTVTGKAGTESMLDALFANFCIGK